jgi:hypothetical protein
MRGEPPITARESMNRQPPTPRPPSQSAETPTPRAIAFAPAGPPPNLAFGSFPRIPRIPRLTSSLVRCVPAPSPAPTDSAKFYFWYHLVRFGSVWFGLVPSPLLHLAAFARPSSVTQLSTLRSTATEDGSTFSLFRPVLRLQTPAFQPLARRETKKRKNFNFGAAVPRCTSPFHSGTLNSQLSTLNSQLLQPPSV